MNQQNWRGRGYSHGRGDRSNRSNVDCYSYEKYGRYTKDCYAKKKVGENANLLEEDETKDEGILMMANKDITLDSDMVWYLDAGASKHMCEHKHLSVDIKKLEDGHVSFRDSTNVPIKCRVKISFSQKGWKRRYYEGLLCT